MRRTHLIKHSGPYKVSSLSDGRLLVYPAWYNRPPEWTPKTGGGPGLFSRMGLAYDLEHFLNAPYDLAAVTEWVEHGADRRDRPKGRFYRDSTRKKM